MNKLVIITLLIPLLYAQCWANCNTCNKNNSAYTCTSCSDIATPYFYSCQTASRSTTIPFVIITIVVTLMHLFMLFVGVGVYHDIF